MNFKLIHDHQPLEILIQSGRSDVTLKKHLGQLSMFLSGDRFCEFKNQYQLRRLPVKTSNGEKGYEQFC